MVDRSWHRLVVYAALISLAACSGPQPILRSNKQLHLYGRQMAQQEVESCRKKVERTGLQSGVHQSANAATGAVLGLTLGGAVGASVSWGDCRESRSGPLPAASWDFSSDCSEERSSPWNRTRPMPMQSQAV